MSSLALRSSVLLAASLALLPACVQYRTTSPDFSSAPRWTADQTSCVRQVLTSQTQIDGATMIDGAMPAGSERAPRPDDGPSCSRLEGSSPLPLGVTWSGGAVAAVLVGFGGGSYFRVPVPGPDQLTGQLVLRARTGDFCQKLRELDCNLCHQIECYEQIVTPDGTVSKAAATQMLIDCGATCDPLLPSIPVPDAVDFAASPPPTFEEENGRPHGFCALPASFTPKPGGAEDMWTVEDMVIP